MVDIEILKKKIFQSPWNDLQKEQVVEFLPILPNQVLDLLEKRLAKSDFLLIKEELYLSLFDGAEAWMELKEGKPQALIDFLKVAYNNIDYNFGAYLTPLVLASKQFIGTGKFSFNAELIDQLHRAEVENLRDLPKQELLIILNKDLLFFIQSADLIAEFKRRYLQETDGRSPEWAQDYLYTLRKNEEVLGTSKIIVNNKKVDPEIQNWLLDYLQSMPSENAQRGTYYEIRYLQKNTNVSTLNQADQDILTKILKFYNWLLRPIADLEFYEASNGNNQSDIKLSGVPKVPVKLKKDVVRRSELVTNHQKFSSINIDKKLEELKKKIK